MSRTESRGVLGVGREAFVQAIDDDVRVALRVDRNNILQAL
jgi:hypothetical protein